MMIMVLIALLILATISVLGAKKLNICFECGPNCSNCPYAGSCSSSCDDEEDSDDENDEDEDDEE